MTIPAVMVVSLAALPALAYPGSQGQCTTCHGVGGDGSVHGTWGETTSACAVCHRTHSAEADSLIRDSSELCLFCHGSTAGNAYTNVVEGVYRGEPAGVLRGGGFEMATMNTDTNMGDVDDEWQFPVSEAEPREVTSKHTLGVEGLIWGSSNVSSDELFYEAPVAGTHSTTLECVSCHNPHEFGQTYRMLREQPLGAPISDRGSTTYAYVTDQLTSAVWDDPDILNYTTDDYTEVDYASPDVYDEDGNIVQVTYDSHGTPASAPKYSQQMSEWCASCHTRYHAQKTSAAATGSTDSGDAIFAYRHKTGDEMTSDNESSSCGYNGVACHGGPAWFNTNKNLSCLACHVAHGTAAQMDDRVGEMPWPGQDMTDSDVPTDEHTEYGWDLDGNNRSNLLRLDNRGVCQNAYCHPKVNGD